MKNILILVISGLDKVLYIIQHYPTSNRMYSTIKALDTVEIFVLNDEHSAEEGRENI